MPSRELNGAREAAPGVTMEASWMVIQSRGKELTKMMEVIRLHRSKKTGTPSFVEEKTRNFEYALLKIRKFFCLLRVGVTSFENHIK